MGQPVFVSISKKNYVNASDIHRVWQNDDKCMVMFRGDNYFTTITQEQFETLTRIIDRLTIKDEPTHVDSAANVTSSPGPQSEPHQEAGQYPAGSDQSFADWAASLGMYVPVRRAYESDLALVNVAGRMLRVTEDLDTPGLIDATEQVADGQKVVITSMKRDDFTAWMLSQLQGTFCFYGHPMHFGNPSGSKGAMNG